MRLLSLFFPQKCVFCGKIVDNGNVCGKCRENLPRTGSRRAVRHGDFFSCCVSPLFYTGSVRASILRYKFGNRQSYAEVYGDFCAQAVKELLNGKFEIITWVPLSRKGKRKRGYDQSELLAMDISRKVGVPCVKMLVKVRDTPKQSTISDPAQRRANVADAFKAVAPDEIRDKRILLIDDLITTGATLSECSRVLLLAGAEDVAACTLATTKAGSGATQQK